MARMRAAILLTALLTLTALAQPTRLWSFSEEAEEKPWEELKTLLPPYPKDENLIRVQVDGPGDFEYFVDSASVSVGRDGVVRYVAVARSSSRANNVSFEGIRCSGRERKFYAIGRNDGSWSEARNSKWSLVADLPSNRFQAVLFDQYFCPARVIVRDTLEAVRVLKQGGNPRSARPF